MSAPRCTGVTARACLLVSCLLLLFAALTCAAPQGSGYHVIRKMPVGGEGGWDYLTVDAEAHRIYLSRSTHVMVVDEISGKVIGDIADTRDVHGIALARELGRGFISDGAANTVMIFDLKTLRPIQTVDTTGQNPDFILYDPVSKRVFTMNGRSSNITAIDAATGKVVGTVTVTGKPEAAVLDGRDRIFVNIEDQNQVIEFDLKSLAVKNTWSIAPCQAPTGLATDTTHRRLFVGCSDNRMMAVVNADTGKVIATPPIGVGTDATGFDPSSGLAFASCREGVLSIIHEDSPDKFTVVATVNTQAGARTMSLDPETHHVFVVSADLKPAGAPTAENPRPRPQPVPGTFVVLELAQ